MNDWEAGTSSAAMNDFDVFLNHRGPDVKSTFVAHLEDALICAGFRSFLDARSLMKGDPACKSIDQALDMAKVHVAVVSRGYAESKYCLNELVAMMRSGIPVVPVFYDVEPVDLRWVENGVFADALEKHKSKGRSRKKVQEWTDALGALAEITGFKLADYKRDEALLKREVVKAVARLTPSNGSIEVEQYRVGLESPTYSCIKVLESMGACTGMLGLVGMGGIGKTTLAREIYNHFVAQKKFRCMSFLEIPFDPSTSSNMQGVTPTWSRELRKQLMWDLLRVENSAARYYSWFQKVSSAGPTLIVIDNVHRLGQFEELIPSTSALHPGSRTIVTSRDRSVLNKIASRTQTEHCLFDVCKLGVAESNVLFNWHAFHIKEAPKEFEDLAKSIVKACGGLPLALKVTGSSLFDKRLDEDRETIWPEAVDALRQSSDVMDVLRWSYDNLAEVEKRMFVDVTCFFYNGRAAEALAFWEGCRNSSYGGIKTPHTSLRSLIDKNLMECSRWGEFIVHDLLKELGQKIGEKAGSHFVCGSMEEVGETMNQSTHNVIGLNLALSKKQKFDALSFTNMPNLHYLALPEGCSIFGDFRCMSKELRFLQWKGMPLSSIPTELDLFHLTLLNFSESTNLASLWADSNTNLSEVCPNLFQLNLSSTSITKLPDTLGQSSQLESLNLAYCRKLEKLPKSIGQLKALKNLFLTFCESLKDLPDSIGTLSNLNQLSTLGCKSIVKFSSSISPLSNLIELGVECQGTNIDGKIGECWTRLRRLVSLNCDGLGSILDYGAFKSLEFLQLDCSTLIELPESIGLLKCLRRLYLNNCEMLQCFPNSIGNLEMLQSLSLCGGEQLERLPETLGALSNLEYLIIQMCSIKKLPKSIGQLSQLYSLCINQCKNLQKLPTSIRQLKSLMDFQLLDCGSIEAMGALTTLQGLPLWGNTSVTKLPPSLGIVSTLAVHGSRASFDCFRFLFLKTCRVWEDDENGFLRAYQNTSTGLSLLLRCEEDPELDSSTARCFARQSIV